MKKLLSILLCLVMVMGVFAMTVSAAEETPVSVSISDYATANGWKDATQYKTITMDSVISVSVTGGGNTGKYYANGNNWRLYQGEGATLKFTASTGKIIKTVKVTYSPNNNGTLVYSGSKIASGNTVTINAASVTFNVGNTGTATNGQVRITKIDVVYTDAGADVCTHDNATYTKTAVGHQMDCADCDDTFAVEAHSYTNKVCTVCGHELYTPAHLDKVVLYHIAENKYVSATANGTKLAPGTAVELVVVLENGKYQFVTADGKYLTTGATGGSLTFENASSDYSIWTLDAASSGWIIKNNKAVYNNNAQCIEFYDGAFTTYSLYSGGPAYVFLFENKGTASSVPGATCEHANAAWTPDGDGCKKVCPDCSETVDTKAAHDFTNGDCVCGTKAPVSDDEEDDDTTTEDTTKPSKPVWEKVDAPEAGVAFKLGMYQVTLGKTLYFNGGNCNHDDVHTYHLGATDKVSEAVDVYVEETNGGYFLYFMKDGVKTYIELCTYNTTSSSLKLVTTPTHPLTWNAEKKAFFATVDGVEMYLGAYDNRDFFSANQASQIDETSCFTGLYVETAADTADSFDIIAVLLVAVSAVALGGVLLNRKKFF